MARTNQVFVDVIAIVGVVSILAITIACLGLLGMATFTVERRVKEVGIRIVFGTGELRIIFILSNGFVGLVLKAMLIAGPLTYLISNFWLQHFANRVDFGPGTILLGSLIMLVLGLLTITSQTYKAARANPVDSLRGE